MLIRSLHCFFFVICRCHCLWILNPTAHCVMYWRQYTNLKQSKAGKFYIIIQLTSTSKSDKVLWIAYLLMLLTGIVCCRRRFDFPNPSRVDRNVEMFLQIEKSLQQSSYDFLPRPQVCSSFTFPHHIVKVYR